MKYILVSLLVLLMALGCAVLSARSGGDNELEPEIEVFEGTGRGYRGPITVQLRMRGGNIMEINIVDSAEDRFVGGAALEELSDLVLEYNSTDVDAITGATESSRGFLEAVDNAIMKR